jgi:hypothetical protein
MSAVTKALRWSVFLGAASRSARIRSAATARRSWMGFLLLAFAMVSATQACETPVYRYAMYRWQPAPYEIYFFHKGDRGGAGSELEDRINEVSEGSDNRANVVFLPINLADDPDLLSVPPDIKQGWLTQEEKRVPSYLVSTPYGVRLYSGELTVESIDSLVDSPVRKSMATQLESGKVGVFLLLKGQDEAANEGARSILDEVVADVGAGKISLYVPPVAEEEASPKNPQFELGLLEVDRESEEEAWLIRSLLAVEPDLTAEQRPMVFLVYGRARALLPYIGKGISRENLLREVEFISGACSCTVKDQNPGIDLLVRYDWEAASAAIAERVGSEEGNESSMGGDMFFPELIIPSSDQASGATATLGDIALGDTAPTEAELDDVAANENETEVASGETGQEASASEAVGGAPVIAMQSTGSQDENAVAALAAASRPVPEATGKTDLSVFGIVGGGLAIALVILFGITLVVLRPQ